MEQNQSHFIALPLYKISDWKLDERPVYFIFGPEGVETLQKFKTNCGFGMFAMWGSQNGTFL